MSTSDSCKNSASKSSGEDGVCEVNDMLNNMSMADNNVSVCANCGKEGGDINNICNKCKQVKYCNATCKKKHKKKHKKQCEEHIRLAADRAAELHDEELFKQPPPNEDCPICFVCLPTLEMGRKYQACCGKVVCSGCSYAPVYDNQGNEVDIKTCPFCRIPCPPRGEGIKRLKKRMEAGDAIAIYYVGCIYQDGKNGYPQDYKKALELYHRAGELGHHPAYCNIGYCYNFGQGVEVDKKKAKHYYELAAMRGDVQARHNLGGIEHKAFKNEVARLSLGIVEGNVDNLGRAIKHFMIAIRGGKSESLGVIKDLYSDGLTTKEDYTKALQLYQEYLGEIKSVQRDEAAAADDRYRYY